MLNNRIIERASQGEKALGLGLSQPSGELVELAGRMGLDFVSFDGQHSPYPPDVIEDMCRIANGLNLTVTSRIADGEESTILSYLDRGVQGLVIPNLQTRAEAEAWVKYSFYAPQGLRSAASFRVSMFQTEQSRPQLYAEINAATLIIPQIESITAVENLDEILAVEGIHYFAGGLQDMAQSLGLPGQPSHPQVQAAYARATEKIHAAGKHWFDEVTESLSLFMHTRAGIGDLLRKHGREPQISYG